jgi:2-polyprenyl-3-methyl-5-hydroxy-6-metoxy-1,4-benzoquinol methylase
MADSKQLFYDRFAEQFDSKMNMYDTEKRVRVVYDELLTEDLRGKKLLDAGSGTGWFSLRAVERGAEVTSLDIGPKLLEQVAKKCETTRVVGDICNLEFPNHSFDYVVSSEVIEHVPEPRQAIRELARVLRPGGVLVLTTPNRIWHFAITIANKTGARPYEGYENWVGYGELRRWFQQENLIVEHQRGMHLVPFVSPMLYPFIDFMDRFGKSLGPLMLNQAIRAKKPGGE